MKKLLFVVVFVLISCRNVSAAIFTIDADLNSISPIYYQNVIPSYSPASLDTGLFFNQGDLLEISSSGVWSNAPESYNLIFGPNGNSNENIAFGYPGAGYPVAGLMAKIGDGGYFFVGSSYSDYISKSGTLYLGFNDTDYGNNWGLVQADVKISPIPEPMSWILLVFGMLGGGAIRRMKRNR